MLSLARHYPNVHFTAYEINEDAFRVASRVHARMRLANVTLLFCDILTVGDEWAASGPIRDRPLESLLSGLCGSMACRPG